MKSKLIDGLIIELPHKKNEIYGFGFAIFDDIFWWFHDKNEIVYHYIEDGRTLTGYVELPDDVTCETYEISHYSEDGSLLILIKKT